MHRVISPCHYSTNAAGDVKLAVMRDVWHEDLFERVIPFWTNHSLDTEYGGDTVLSIVFFLPLFFAAI